ncbi:Kinetochore protein mis18 [Gracilariopsis chorda]|uniref:Kinetochore protein mis18 n=1 Tax=Gracilariopsis chorda TaxID=448386 RepID=A0A2V3JBD7_9FLOR|nr:Kinetochore protein mis18 [Gracilariopsis chorda]|eukprot:PXF49820.1 Kinetochore protein mis18 [Gracilariopsis chorda]
MKKRTRSKKDTSKNAENGKNSIHKNDIVMSERSAPEIREFGPAKPSEATVDAQNEPDSTTHEGMAGEEPDIFDDIVFQCGECNVVVGDTKSRHLTDVKNGILSLKIASNVKVEDRVHVCQSGFAAGCTFKRIMCLNCKSPLGRVYASTVASLDVYRSLFTFNCESLQTYKLGSGKTLEGKCIPDEESNQPAPQNNGSEATVTVEDFVTLDKYVANLGKAVNNLTDAFGHYGGALEEMRREFRDNNDLTKDIRQSLEYVQNIILVWEERFRSFDAFRQNTTKSIEGCQRQNDRVQHLEGLKQEVAEMRKDFEGCRRLQSQVTRIEELVDDDRLRSSFHGSIAPISLKRPKSASKLRSANHMPSKTSPLQTIGRRRR